MVEEYTTLGGGRVVGLILCDCTSHGYETPCCCEEIGWLVDGQRLLPPNPDRGSTVDPPPQPKSRRAQGDMPVAQVWARLGLTQMASRRARTRREPP